MLLAGAVLAQDAPVITPLEVTRSDAGQAYLDDLRFTRIDAEVVYVDQLEGEITVDTRLPDPPQEDQSAPPRLRLGEGPNPLGVALLGALVAAFAFLLWKYGGGLKGRLAREGADRPAPAHTDAPPQQTAPPPGLVARLRAMSDRRAALVLLLRHSLHAAAHANQLRHVDSETARELLRRVPSAWPLREALRKIITAEELVQFGGRALADETFEECLTLAQPILAGRST